jgi:hypothetical protein
MPLHDYQSDDGHIIEKLFSIKDDIPPTIEVDGVIYRKIFSVPTIIIDSTKPKTVGALAAKNTEKMVSEGKLAKKKEKKNPWWRPNKKKADLSLNRMSEQQKIKYIREGKTP